MYYRQHYPGSALNDCIECFWIMRMSLEPKEHMDRLVPGGRIELIFNFSSPISWMQDENGDCSGKLSDSHLMGQRSKVYYASLKGPLFLMGVRFKPAGLSAFTKLPAANLLNGLVEAEQVFDSSIRNWKERLLACACDEDRFLLLEELMLALCKTKPDQWNQVNAMIGQFRQQSAQYSIEQVCARMQVNYKKLERVFHQYAGYSPKQYSSLIRFNHAIRKISKGNDSLTSTGLDCGYYDQSHFIKDCIRFTGTTPGRLRTDENTIAGILLANQAV
ncbi:MAG: hypothetical protein C5B59_15850 [Bacteroidetes bacterium]|nr:MAG: hypothetical protein C5B59_15850 [Bacteroidota bacterium]